MKNRLEIATYDYRNKREFAKAKYKSMRLDTQKSA